MNKEIEKKLTVEDLVKLRNEAVSLENEIVEKLKRFNEIGNKVGGYFCSDFLRDISAYNPKIENCLIT